MCKSIAQGGQRCAGHTRGAFNHAVNSLQHTRKAYAKGKPGADDPVGLRRWERLEPLSGLEDEVLKTGKLYGSTQEGSRIMLARIEELEQGNDFESAALMRNALQQGQNLRASNQTVANRFDPDGIPGVKNSSYEPVVLKVDEERGITYTWYDMSLNKGHGAPRSFGLETAELVITDREGKKVGELALSFTTKKLNDQAFPNNIAYGLGDNMDIDYIFNESNFSPQQKWLEVFSKYNREVGSPQSAKNKHCSDLTIEDAPLTEAEVNEDFRVAGEKFAEKRKAWVRWASTPYVAWSEVEPELQGTGLGADMYVTAAKHLATQGRTLRASGLQSPEAERLWAKLERVGVAKLKTTPVFPPGSEKQKNLTIDMRPKRTRIT